MAQYRSPLTLSASQLIAATVLSAGLIPLLGWETPQLRFDALVAVAILGALGTGVASVINYRLITDDGATAASVVTYLLPVIAIVIGASGLHESSTFTALAGTVVVLVGVAASRHQPKPRDRTWEEARLVSEPTPPLPRITWQPHFEIRRGSPIGAVCFATQPASLEYLTG